MWGRRSSWIRPLPSRDSRPPVRSSPPTTAVWCRPAWSRTRSRSRSGRKVSTEPACRRLQCPDPRSWSSRRLQRPRRRHGPSPMPVLGRWSGPSIASMRSSLPRPRTFSRTTERPTRCCNATPRRVTSCSSKSTTRARARVPRSRNSSLQPRPRSTLTPCSATLSLPTTQARTRRPNVNSQVIQPVGRCQ